MDENDPYITTLFYGVSGLQTKVITLFKSNYFQQVKLTAVEVEDVAGTI